MSSLQQQQCRHYARDEAPLTAAQRVPLLAQIDSSWRSDDDKCIERTFCFADFGQTMTFVNAVAWIAQQQDHHPEMFVAYAQCRLRFSTHSLGGLSENDFICAAKVDHLFATLS